MDVVVDPVKPLAAQLYSHITTLCVRAGGQMVDNGEPLHVDGPEKRTFYWIWCGRGDSNPHDLAIASPSS
jgi:hypothetical protein